MYQSLAEKWALVQTTAEVRTHHEDGGTQDNQPSPSAFASTIEAMQTEPAQLEFLQPSLILPQPEPLPQPQMNPMNQLLQMMQNVQETWKKATRDFEDGHKGMKESIQQTQDSYTATLAALRDDSQDQGMN